MVSVAILMSLCNAGLTDVQADALVKTLLAVAMVESGGDPCATGDGGRAVGILQIRPIMVADVNRIVGQQQRYTLADRRDVRKSVEMFVIYCLHYWPAGGPEQWARAWNGGPDGPQQAETEGYWRRVQTEIARQRAAQEPK
ncbi:MAG TPA: transglycosylase SLT domain-containing protein [Sedimentisphaerales bacterium]|nr:transglycosylase SLT domain-containing protein [Sedimentisphaerales bacterium]HRS13201.1 transglycosylase SLT domain-containing protein [Sedimentisphaerales bacterium]